MARNADSKEGGAVTLDSLYIVLADPPDAKLDDMDSNYTGSNKEWRNQWTTDAKSVQIDGQKTIEILEIACYADVICHRIEYPLRIATLDYVRNHLKTPGVRESLEWIRTSYKSGLSMEVPGDTAGEFTGALVQSMKTRLTEYANDLLVSHHQESK